MQKVLFPKIIITYLEKNFLKNIDSNVNSKIDVKLKDLHSELLQKNLFNIEFEPILVIILKIR